MNNTNNTKFRLLRGIVPEQKLFYIVKVFMADLILWSIAYFPMGMLYSIIRNGDPFREIRSSIYRSDFALDIISFAIVGAISSLLYKIRLTKKLRDQGYSFELVLEPKSIEKYFPGVSDDLQKLTSLDKNSIFQINRIATIYDLDRRAKNINRRNGFVIFLIASFLISSIVVVVFAGKLTGLDVSSISIVDKIKTEIKDSENIIAVTSRRIFELQQQKDNQSTIQKLSEAIIKNPQAAEVEKIQALINRLISLNSSSERSIFGENSNQIYQLDALQLKKEKALEQQSQFRELLRKTIEKQSNSDDTSIDWRYITSTAITRVGVILIIVFLVQILLGLYRYNTRLSTYYSSTKDVVRLYDGDTDKIGIILASFGPPKVNFDKDPKHPLEDIIKLASQKIDEASSKNPKNGG